MIPRVFHQVWLGASPLPEDFAAYRETWREHHPGWEFHLWTEENLPPDLRRSEIYERLRFPAERADLLRYEMLWRFGGLYADTDFECRRSIEPFLDDHDFVLACLNNVGRTNNALIGAKPGHPIMDRAIREARPIATHGYDKARTGPVFLDLLVKEHPDTPVLPRELFYPDTPGEIDKAVAVHHAARSWKDSEGWQHSARLAESRLEKARRRTDELERKLTRTTGKLEEAQSRLERSERKRDQLRDDLERLRRSPVLAVTRRFHALVRRVR